MNQVDKMMDLLLAKKWGPLNKPFLEVNVDNYPGVYILGFTKKRLLGKSIRLGDIYYVGMSNAEGGLRSRLKIFLKAIEGRGGHSAGNRFYKEHLSETPFSESGLEEQFFVAT